MSSAEQRDPRERLRRLAEIAGISLTDDELERLTPSAESLATGLRRLHDTDLNGREPVLVYRPKAAKDE